MSLVELAAIVVALINAIIIPWAIWVTKSLFQLVADLKMNQQTDSSTNDLVAEVKQLFIALAEDLSDIKLALAEKGIRVKRTK